MSCQSYHVVFKSLNIACGQEQIQAMTIGEKRLYVRSYEASKNAASKHQIAKYNKAL